MVQGQLFAGGGFVTGTERNGASSGHLARWDGVTWSNVVEGGWTADMGQPYRYPGELHVWALASRGSELYVAGNFATIGNVPSYGFGIWREGSPPAVRARLREGSLVLSAPRQFQVAALEFTESLSPMFWTTVPNVNWTVSNTSTNEVEVKLTPSRAQAFYRLRWP
jgi:hypothetical protein